MEVQVLEMSPRDVKVELVGTTAAQGNAIRRTLLADIPKLAIDDVEFHLGPIRDEATGKDYDSSTSMFDEAVALRLGLLPIPTDLGEFRRKSECTCGGEGCPHCQVMYAVDRKGPCTVYARDVTPLGDASLAMLEPEVPIVRLGARQALLAYATAVVGSARDHAKWQVAHAVGVWPRVTVRTQKRPGCTPECLERVVRSAPAGMLEIEDGRLRLADENPERAVDLVGLERVCPHGSLQLEIDESRRFLRFETDGSLTARDAFRFAIRDLKRRFEELREAVQALP